MVLGYLNDHPAHWTQGKTLKELEEMLADLSYCANSLGTELVVSPLFAGYYVVFFTRIVL